MSETRYYQGEPAKSGHTDDHCDRCQALVGRNKLEKAPFLYCDKNDKDHPDVSHFFGLPYGAGYRQYYLCKSCYKEELKKK